MSSVLAPWDERLARATDDDMRTSDEVREVGSDETRDYDEMRD